MIAEAGDAPAGDAIENNASQAGISIPPGADLPCGTQAAEA